MTTLNARNLTLEDVEHLLKLEERYDGFFTPLLSLEPITEFEQLELVQIPNDFRPYLKSGKASEGQVKLVVVSPLLRLAGFYRYPIQLQVEEDIFLTPPAPPKLGGVLSQD